MTKHLTTAEEKETPLVDIKIDTATMDAVSPGCRTRFVPALKGFGCATLVWLAGVAGIGYTAYSLRLFPTDGVANIVTNISVLFIGLFFWMLLYVKVTWWLLCTQEHPESAAATMAEDASLLHVPSTGGEGKTAVVVGGGISGLCAAQYLLRAGFAKVTLLEGRPKAGGNNEPHMDGEEEHATTCVFTSPSQQPHYAELCRQLGVQQTSHELQTVDGAVILGDKSIACKFGGDNEVYKFLRRAFWQISWFELIDGLTIFCLLYYQYQLRPESAVSISQLLGSRLASSNVFRDFYMGWVGVNVWCRFNDLDNFPAHAFATFIFEYACPLKHRDVESTLDCCVLDGRLIRALESANNSTAPRYEQHLCTEAVKIRKDPATGKKHVLARRTSPHAATAEPAAAKAKQLSTLGYDSSGYWSGAAGDQGTRASRGVDGDGASAAEALITFECDVVVLATQPGPGLAILAASTSAPTKEEAPAALECPSIPAALPTELAKWSSMECFTFVHCDDELAKGTKWVHETLHNSENAKPYAHYAIHPRVGDMKAKFWISYVYGREHAMDFVANHVDADKIVDILTPTLPIFTGENTVARNVTWRNIDLACSDVFWTSCCRSGLQFHNNGILSAKRVVLAILNKGW